MHSCAVVTEGQHHTERQEHPSSVQSHRPELHVGIAVLLDRSENSSRRRRPDKMLTIPCNHNNDLWPAEDEEWDEEGLWGRSEDDSKTNTDSEAEDALEFMLAFA